MALINVEKIQWVLENSTSYAISKRCGISAQAIDKYKNGTSDLLNMRLKHGLAMTEYAEELEEIIMSKLNEIQLTIYSELKEKVETGEFSYNDAVAIWEDERGIYSYSLEERDLENHYTIVTIREALTELAKLI